MSTIQLTGNSMGCLPSLCRATPRPAGITRIRACVMRRWGRPNSTEMGPIPVMPTAKGITWCKTHVPFYEKNSVIPWRGKKKRQALQKCNAHGDGQWCHVRHSSSTIRKTSTSTLLWWKVFCNTIYHQLSLEFYVSISLWHNDSHTPHNCASSDPNTHFATRISRYCLTWSDATE